MKCYSLILALPCYEKPDPERSGWHESQLELHDGFDTVDLVIPGSSMACLDPREARALAGAIIAHCDSLDADRARRRA